jgi:hypothetical protein
MRTFSELPGLSLHLHQAARLFAIPLGPCRDVLDDLVRRGQLRRTEDGQYAFRDPADFAGVAGSAHLRRPGSAVTPVPVWVVGLAGGLFAGLAMNLFSRAVANATCDLEGEGAAAGTERAGRGAQPPQARGTADQDAATIIGAALYRTVTGADPDRSDRLRLGAAVHYVFSGVLGMCYAVTARQLPAVRAGFGTAYGTLVWAVADEGAVPALGLSRAPDELPAGVHLYALASHWIYGAALESVARVRLPASQS